MNSLYTTILVEREDFEVGEEFIFEGITIMNSLYTMILFEREDSETVNVWSFMSKRQDNATRKKIYF